MNFSKEIALLEEASKGISAKESEATDPYDITDIQNAKGGIHVAYIKLLGLQKKHKED